MCVLNFLSGITTDDSPKFSSKQGIDSCVDERVDGVGQIQEESAQQLNISWHRANDVEASQDGDDPRGYPAQREGKNHSKQRSALTNLVPRDCRLAVLGLNSTHRYHVVFLNLFQDFPVTEYRYGKGKDKEEPNHNKVMDNSCGV